jgi:hypothetical protein
VVAFFATLVLLTVLWLILPHLWRALRGSLAFLTGQWRAVAGGTVSPPPLP